MVSNDINKVITNKNILSELAKRDINTLEELAALSADELQTIQGIGEKTAPRIRASAQAYLQNKPIWFGTVPQSIRKAGAILDIRVDPDTLPQLPWGFCLSSPSQEKHYLIDVPEIELPTRLHLPDGKVVGLVPKLASAWAQVRDLALENQWVIYFWGKAVLKHVNETAPKKVQKDLKPIMLDLHKIFMDVVALPTESTGLVDTAKFLGYTGWAKDEKPYMAHLSYLHWRKNPNRADALQDALNQMKHNTDAISRIWWWLTTGGMNSN